MIYTVSRSMYFLDMILQYSRICVHAKLVVLVTTYLPRIDLGFFCFINFPILRTLEWWDAVLQKRLASALFVLLLSTFVCCQPTELIWIFFCFIKFSILLPPSPQNANSLSWIQTVGHGHSSLTPSIWLFSIRPSICLMWGGEYRARKYIKQIKRNIRMHREPSTSRNILRFTLEWWDAVLLAWALIVLLLSIIMYFCLLFLGNFCFINFPIFPPPPPQVLDLDAQVYVTLPRLAVLHGITVEEISVSQVWWYWIWWWWWRRRRRWWRWLRRW